VHQLVNKKIFNDIKMQGTTVKKSEYNLLELQKSITYFVHMILTHCGRVTQICVFTLQLCRTGDTDLRF